mgnify:CR=1 FL=1
MLLSIITPIYNRENFISLLFENVSSIKGNLEWIIVNDGSTDNSDKLINKYQMEYKLNLKYQKITNGGKHRALNYAMQYVTGDLVIVLDSDDTLSIDCYSLIKEQHSLYSSDDSIAGYIFQKQEISSGYIQKNFSKQRTIKANLYEIINKGILGDKAEVIKTNVFKEYKYPEISGEKFISEGVVWVPMGTKYKFIFVNHPIYYYEYLDGGLTKSGRSLRIKNPIGGLIHAEKYINKNFKLSLRLKYSILFNVYYNFIDKTIRRNYKKRDVLILLTYLPSLLIYIYWKKYLKSQSKYTRTGKL